ncbi:MAG: hypothetical protein ACKOBS_02575, partial [Verrucomicrobiota bacterium]
VELGPRSYPVRIGAGMRREALAVAERRLAAGRKCVAITSPGVAAAQPGFAAELARLMPVLATAADGETAKSAAELARLWDVPAANGVARDGAVVALGGGVVGDLAGFAAASYQRGGDAGRGDRHALPAGGQTTFGHGQGLATHPGPDADGVGTRS